MTIKMVRRSSLVISCLILSIAASAEAKIFFLDNRQGVVNGSTTYDPSTRSTSSGSSLVYTSPWDAGKALANGDTLYVREGEYYEDITGKPGYMWWLGSLTITASNCVIKNYNSEVAWIKGGASRTTPQYHPNNAVNLDGSNNTIDGLYIYGGFIISGTSNTLQNSDLSGGWDHQAPWMTPDAGWPNCIRFIDSTNARVRNSRIHDNIMQSGNKANMAIIMHERDDNTVIENCEFYNTAAYFGYLKYQNGSRSHAFTGSGTHVTYRFNVFKGPNGGVQFATTFPDAPNPVQNQVFYQNLFINCMTIFHGPEGPNQGVRHAWVYNNTFYNAIGGLSNWLSSNIYNWFNNIVYWDITTSMHYNINFESSTPDPFVSNYIDYVQYYSPNGNMAEWIHGSFFTTTLSAWVTHSGNRVETHSFVLNPGFINASGQFNAPTDFRRSSYPAVGRGGGYSSILGAYVTGNEVIGTNPGGLPPIGTTPPPLPPPKVPNAPTGLIIY